MEWRAKCPVCGTTWWALVRPSFCGEANCPGRAAVAIELRVKKRDDAGSDMRNEPLEEGKAIPASMAPVEEEAQ